MCDALLLAISMEHTQIALMIVQHPTYQTVSVENEYTNQHVATYVSY